MHPETIHGNAGIVFYTGQQYGYRCSHFPFQIAFGILQIFLFPVSVYGNKLPDRLRFGLFIFHQSEVGFRSIIITAILLNIASGAVRLNRRLPFAFFQNVLVEQSALLLIGIAGIANIILRHGFLYDLHGAILHPGTGDIVIKHLIQAEASPIDLQSLDKVDLILRYLHIVNIAHNDIEVCILGMMQVINFPAFQHIMLLIFIFGLIAKVRSKGSLHINDLRTLPFVKPFQNPGHSLGGLPCFHQLTVDKGGKLIIGQFVIPGQPFVFLLRDQPPTFKEQPKALHFTANLFPDRISITFKFVFILQHKNAIVEAVILDLGSRENVVNVITVAAQQLIQVDGFTAVGAFPQLGIVEKELVLTQLIVTAAFQILHQSPVDIVTALFIKIQKLLLSGNRPFFHLIGASCHLNKDLFRRMLHNLFQLFDDQQRLINGPLHLWRNVKLFHHLTQILFLSKGVHLGNLLFKGLLFVPVTGKNIAVKDLHQIQVRFPHCGNDIHHLSCGLVSGRNIGKEFPGQPTPAAVFQLCQLFKLILGQAIAKAPFQPLLQQLFVVAKNGNRQNNFLFIILAEVKLRQLPPGLQRSFKIPIKTTDSFKGDPPRCQIVP